ncbi:hypothetical protein MMC30_002629 [Trapelia coarctata]|nr:hypothetical protein [Trapelia coarctata]
MPYEKDVPAYKCEHDLAPRDRSYHHRRLFASRDEAVGADPIKIPFLTDWILFRLEGLSEDSFASKSSSTKKMAHYLSCMPTEIIDIILSHLNFSMHTSVHCTRILAPTHWRRALMHFGVLPWLWDLDYKAINDKELTCGSMILD